ncbi:MAG: response regulator [Alphaproteobacteria bacterium]
MSGKRLLIVEDEPGIADLILRIAGEMGFIVKTASGREVLSVYHAFEPEIILLDIVMPDMDGLEVLQFLRQQGSEARVIILSGGLDSYRRLAQNMALGGGLAIDGNLSKPFRASDLRLALERASRQLPRPGAKTREPQPAPAAATKKVPSTPVES